MAEMVYVITNNVYFVIRKQLKPKLMQSMFLGGVHGGVDMEEVEAAMAPVERLVETDDTSSDVHSPSRALIAAKDRLQLSSKSNRDKLLPRMHFQQTPEEKAEALKKVESGEINKLITTLRVNKPNQKELESVSGSAQSQKMKLNEKMFDKHGNPMDGTVLASSLNEVTKKKLPKIVLTGKNTDAMIEEIRGSDFFQDNDSIGKSFHSGVIDMRNYYGLESRQRMFHHYKKMNRQSLIYTGTESTISPQEIASHGSVYSTLSAARNNIQQAATDNQNRNANNNSSSSQYNLGENSLASLTTAMTTNNSAAGGASGGGSRASSPYAGLYIRNERRTPAHPLEAPYLSKLDVYAGVDEELVNATRSNYFSYKCLSQKVYKDDDDDDDEGSDGDGGGDGDDDEDGGGGGAKGELSKLLGIEQSTTTMTLGLAEVSRINPSIPMEEEANIMCSPRTKYLGGCIREKLAPLPRLVCRIHKESRGIDVKDYGFGDRSKFVVVCGLLLLHLLLFCIVVGRVFAECMYDLPNVERLDISGNSLTDHSLPYLLDALAHMPHLTELNLSRNKIDDKASEALARYVSNPNSPVVRLIMQNADVDDFECAAFVETLKTNTHLRDLDLSNNLLGSAEILNSVFGGLLLALFVCATFEVSCVSFRNNDWWRSSGRILALRWLPSSIPSFGVELNSSRLCDGYGECSLHQQDAHVSRPQLQWPR